MADFVEDLPEMFAELGVPALLDGIAVHGIFDRPYVEAFGGMASSLPTFQLPTASCVDTSQESLLVLDDSTWRVRSIEPDGTGVTTLALELQP